MCSTSSCAPEEFVRFFIVSDNGKMTHAFTNCPFVNRFLEFLRTKRAYNTWVNYAYTLRDFLETVGKCPGEITSEDCWALVRQREEAGYTNGSISGFLSCLSSMFNKLHAFDSVRFPENPVHPIQRQRELQSRPVQEPEQTIPDVLSQGCAQTDEEIISEYQAFLRAIHQERMSTVLRRLQDAPGVMLRRIGKPLIAWTDEAIVGLYQDREKTTHYPYSAFLAYQFFRGYRRATLKLLTSLPMNLARQHRQALAPYQERLKKTQRELGYEPRRVGTELNLLLWLRATTGKPLDGLSRADFDAFEKEYLAWYKETGQRADGKRNSRLSCLERYLVHWGMIPPAQRVLRHKELFAQLHHPIIQGAIQSYIQWCRVKYSTSTLESRRTAALYYFLWFQEHYPNHTCLDDVSRSIALEYARYLKGKVYVGEYSQKYVNDLYRGIRQVYKFVIREELNTSPARNPFRADDLPQDPDSAPRALSDAEWRKLDDYCRSRASLKEKTLVIVLIQTGVRAAELAALKATDIVQIAGRWKLHVREGKGLKDRMIPLTLECLAALREWQEQGWERANEHLFTYRGRPWKGGRNAGSILRELGRKIEVRLTPHRLRHTFAVALLNYGLRESVLQKLMGHSTLGMTLEYAKILDRTVESQFNEAVSRMEDGTRSWVPSFFKSEDYALFVEEHALNWIRLPIGYCRRHHKMHCEADVKCLLCDRFCVFPDDLPRLQKMNERFLQLEMQAKADIVASHIQRLEVYSECEALDRSPPSETEQLQPTLSFE